MTRAVARSSARSARTSTRTARTSTRATTAGSTSARSTAARMAIGRAASALGQWLRRPLTSLHLVLGVFGLLTLFGLVMVLSASSVEAYTAGGSSYSVFTKQLLFCVPGLAMFYLGLRIPPRQLRALAPVFLVVCVVLEGALGRIREMEEGPDGYIYFSTSNRDGRGTPAKDDDRIMRIVPEK